jgi:threonine dehydrogenase-like Zn-dependent dehydrogenase
MHHGILPLPFLPAMLKEVRIVMSVTYNRHAGGRDFDAAAALLAANPQIASQLITHRFRIEDAPAAFAAAGDRASGAIKVVLEPGG